MGNGIVEFICPRLFTVSNKDTSLASVIQLPPHFYRYMRKCNTSKNSEMRNIARLTIPSFLRYTIPHSFGRTSIQYKNRAKNCLSPIFI